MRPKPLYETVRIESPAFPAELECPADATALVLLVDGSGASRLGRRVADVTEVLHAHHLATLHFADAAQASARRQPARFERLASRTEQMLDWIGAQADLAGLSVGLLGAESGAAAAVWVAAHRPGNVAALVSHAGRPELAGESLGLVQAPTLLIVGAQDPELVDVNRASLGRLACRRRLEVVPGAGRDFSEAGTLNTMAHLAGGWFETHLGAGRPQ